MLSGLYQLPNIDDYYSDKELYDTLGEWGLSVSSLAYDKDAKHVFTHIDWMMKAYAVTVKEPCGRFLWVTEDERKTTFPLPTAFQKLLK